MSSKILDAPDDLHDKVYTSQHTTLTPTNSVPEKSHSEILEEGVPPDLYLVTWDVDDPDDPQNWSRARRWYISVVGGLLILNASFSSSAPSGALPGIISDLNMSSEAAILILSLFIGGYCLGPLFWGPLSEVYGRRPMYLISFFFYLGWQLGSAMAPNTASLLIFRFLAGSFAACPLTNMGGMNADIWNARDRGKSMAMFTLAPFAGPALGPIVGGYVYVSGATWRWVFWAMFIYSSICFVLVVFTMPETYAPVLLKRKAQRKRAETGDSRYYAPIEKVHFSFQQIIVKVLGRPVKMLFTEPMLAATTLYISFNYGCLYMLFEAYPVIFTEGHHLNEGVSGLTFIPLFLGGSTAGIIYIIVFERDYIREMDKAYPKPPAPELRLRMALWGGPIYVFSFFWLGWTSFPSISFWVPMLSGIPAGIGITFLFVSLTNYTIDVYLPVAASVLATNTITRSLFGVAFPLFSPAMFHSLNPRWACTLLGGFAAVCAVIPFALVRWGALLRQKSRYSPTF